MARNQVFPDIELLREVWTLAAETESGVAVMQGSRSGVTFSGTPGLKRSETVGPYTISGIPTPSTGQGALRATVMTTGTHEFPVLGGTNAAVTGTKVYFVVADGSLTLTAGTDVFYGVVNLPEGYVFRKATVLPIKIGVVA